MNPRRQKPSLKCEKVCQLCYLLTLEVTFMGTFVPWDWQFQMRYSRDSGVFLIRLGVSRRAKEAVPMIDRIDF